MNKEQKKGLITKATGGFYYVDTENAVYECKARGVFRKNSISPVVGDVVTIEIPEEGYALISNIEKRKNYIVRPPLSNIDNLVLVVSTTEPEPNALIIDKMLAVAEINDITPIIVFTKADLKQSCGLEQIYRDSGFDVFSCSEGIMENKDSFLKLLCGNKITALTGNSGVGKSTLINGLFPDLCLQTGDISKKLGRGRHTTRTVELFKTGDFYIADTPGFSTFDMQRYDIKKKEELAYCFREFNDYIGMCKYSTCTHICEPGCAVINALNDGHIHKSRYNSYCSMYNEIKDLKDWME